MTATHACGLHILADAPTGEPSGDHTATATTRLTEPTPPTAATPPDRDRTPTVTTGP
ncbi:hypothetical protein [Micromonospora sp. WMMD1155]|uniref:hypothetical protein n=1 Tax=Micromonospora sp. WMMD1155 TaxID=3016094 RepID=UPI00249A21B2|nr:hypothetical protein [Micromonospora sp. WMMD1155]WFE52443.1 hypothetical protein O7617_19900 [Micromonospora sp. WMMD1155]